MLGVLAAAAAFGLTVPQHGTQNVQRLTLAAHTSRQEPTLHLAPIIDKLKQMLAHCEEVLNQDGSENTMLFCRESKATLADMGALPEATQPPHAWALHEAGNEVKYLCDDWVPTDKEKLTMHLENMKEVLRTYLEQLACAPGDVPCSEGGTVEGLKPECTCKCTPGYSGDACQIGPPKRTVVSVTACNGDGREVGAAVNIVHSAAITLGRESEILHQGPLDNLLLHLGGTQACQISVTSEGRPIGSWSGRRGGDLDVLDALRNAQVEFTTCPFSGSDTSQVIWANANGGGWVPLDHQGRDRAAGSVDTYVVAHIGPLTSLVVEARGSDAWQFCSVNVDGKSWGNSNGKWLDNPCNGEPGTFLQQRAEVSVSAGGLDRTVAAKGEPARAAPVWHPPPPPAPPPYHPPYRGGHCQDRIDVVSLVR